MRAEGVSTGCGERNDVVSNARDGVKLFWSREVLDTGDLLGGECAETGDVVIPRYGVYEITANIEWPSAPDTTTRTVGVRTADRPYLAADRRANTPGEPTQQSVTTVARLLPGDRVQVWVYQSSAGDLSLAPGLRTSTVSVHWVSP